MSRLCAHCDAMRSAQHSPCCSAHGKPLCCRCYCRLHFVEHKPCSPESHAGDAEVTP